MAFKKINNYDLIRKTILVLLLLPLVASTNIDCGGKAFHCVNSTHFMICVDLGSGVSSTIDNFIIECPPSTVCQKSNYFECEFPSLTTLAPTVGTSANSVLGSSEFTTVWAQNTVSTISPELGSVVSLTETNTVSITLSRVEDVTDNKLVTPITEPTTVPDFIKTTLSTISAFENSTFTFPNVSIAATETTTTINEPVPNDAIETMADPRITEILILSDNFTKINETVTQAPREKTYIVQVENVTGNSFAKLLNESSSFITMIENNATEAGSNTVSITSSRVENVTDNKLVTPITEPTTVPDFIKTTLSTISALDTSTFTFPNVSIAATETTTTINEPVPNNAIETMETGTGNSFAKLLNESSSIITMIENNATEAGFLSTTKSSMTGEVNVEPTKEYYIDFAREKNENTHITDIPLHPTEEITDPHPSLDSQHILTSSYQTNGVNENATNEHQYSATNNITDILVERTILDNTENYTNRIAKQSINRTTYDTTESNASTVAYSTNVSLESTNGVSRTENNNMIKTFERTIPTFSPVTTTEIHSTVINYVTTRDELIFPNDSIVVTPLSDVDKTLAHSENILVIAKTEANYDIQTPTVIVNETTQDTSSTYIEATTVSQVDQPNYEFQTTLETITEALPSLVTETNYEIQMMPDNNSDGIPSDFNKKRLDIFVPTSQSPSDLNYEIETTLFNTETVTEDGNISVTATKNTSLNDNVTKLTEQSYDAMKSFIDDTIYLSFSQAITEANYNTFKSAFESVTEDSTLLVVKDTTTSSYIPMTDSLAIPKPANEIQTSTSITPIEEVFIFNNNGSTAKGGVDITETSYFQSKSAFESATEESTHSIVEETKASSYIPVTISLEPATSINPTKEAFISNNKGTLDNSNIDITEANYKNSKSDIVLVSTLSTVEETKTNISELANEIQMPANVTPTEEALITSVKGTIAKGSIDITKANYNHSKSAFESVMDESTLYIVEKTKTNNSELANEIQMHANVTPTEEALITSVKDTIAKVSIDITEGNYNHSKSAFESVMDESTLSIVEKTNTNSYIPVINSIVTSEPANQTQTSTSIFATEEAIISNIKGTMAKGAIQTATDISSKILDDNIMIKKEKQPVKTNSNESITFTSKVNENNDTINTVTGMYNIVNKNTNFVDVTTEKRFFLANAFESTKDASLGPMVTPRYIMNDKNTAPETSAINGSEILTKVHITNGLMNEVSVTTMPNLHNDQQKSSIGTLGKEFSTLTSQNPKMRLIPSLISDLDFKNDLHQDTLKQTTNKNYSLTDKKAINTFENKKNISDELRATKNLVILDQVHQLDTTVIKDANHARSFAGTVTANNEYTKTTTNMNVANRVNNITSEIEKSIDLVSNHPSGTVPAISKDEPKQTFPQRHIGSIVDSHLNTVQAEGEQNATEAKVIKKYFTKYNAPTQNSTHQNRRISLLRNISQQTTDKADGEGTLKVSEDNVNVSTVTIKEINWNLRSINIDGATTTSETATEGKTSSTEFKARTGSKTYSDREINQGTQNQPNQITTSRNNLNDNKAAVTQKADITTSRDITHEVLITELNYALRPVTQPESIATKAQHSESTTSENYFGHVIDTKKMTTNRTLIDIYAEEPKQARISPTMSSPTQTNFSAIPKDTIDPTDKFSQSGIKNPLFSFCLNRSRGRYPDHEDCTKFYICIGRAEPIVGKCPDNAVFSDIRKHCTRNMAHCVRENLFKCISEGRFSDILQQNVYYICVKRRNNFVKFEFKCQNGYNLNKTTVKCIKEENLSQLTSLNKNTDETSSSDSKNSKETKKAENIKKSKQEFECQQEGKFIDPNNFKKYYVCTRNNKSEFRMRRKSCDSDERFHENKNKCVDADSYDDG